MDGPLGLVSARVGPFTLAPDYVSRVRRSTSLSKEEDVEDDGKRRRPGPTAKSGDITST